MYKILAIIACSLLLFSCDNSEKSKSPLLTKEVTKNNLVSVIEEMDTDEGIIEDDKVDFIRGMRYLVSSPDSLAGKTVNEIIEYGQNRTHEENFKNARVAANQFELKNQVVAKLTKFQPVVGQNGSQNNQLTFEVYNLSDTTMNRISGMIKLFNNMNNSLVKQYQLTIDEPIEAQKGKLKTMNYIHDSTNTRDVFIRNNLSTQAIRWEWVPDTVVYSTGKTLAVPRN